MEGKEHHRRTITTTSFLWLLFLYVTTTSIAQGLWPEENQRLSVGIRLFPACISADMKLAEKRTANGKLRILVLHEQDRLQAGVVADKLQELDQIGGYPLQIDIVSQTSIDQYKNQQIAALFITSPGIQSELFDNWVINHHTLVFSPFAGDVMRGAVAGLHVSDRILPIVNMTQAKRGAISFKPFFLRIAKTYHE